MAKNRTEVERRVESRVPIRVLVEYEKVDDFLADYSSNLSLGGMFIQTDDPLAVGTRFRLRLRLPDRPKPVEAYAEVRWVVPTGGRGTAGMGVQFEDLAPADLKAVEQLLGSWE